MASNEVSIIARLQDNGVLSGVKRIKVALRDLKGEDGKLSWSGLAAGGDATRALGDGIMQAGGALTMGVTVPLVAAGGAAVATASKFDDAMAQVSGALGDPSADMESLRKLALQLGADTVFSATEAGNAMVELAKGGMTEADIKGGALAASMDLAAAGGLNLADAAATTVQMMGSFGLGAGDAARIADALAGAANASSADVSDLTQAMSQCSAQASLAGWSLEETAAALALFADNGIKGSDAGTSLKTMLQRLAAPTDEAATAMQAYGIEARDSEGHMKGVADIAAELQGKLGTLSEAERDMALQTIFGSDASRAAAIMMKTGADGLAKYTDATNDATAAETMAAAQKGDLSWALENMQGSLESAGIAFGTALAPAVEVVAGVVGDAAEAFSNLSPGVQTAIAVVAGLAAALGPLLIVAGAVAGAIPAIQAGMTAMAGAMAAPAAPIVALLAGLAAVTATVMYLWDTNEGFRAAVLDAWAGIQSAFQSACATIVPLVQQAFQGIASFVDRLMKNGMATSIQGALQTIMGLFQAAMALITGVTTGDFSQMGAAVRSIMSGLGNFIGGALSAIAGMFGIDLGGVLSTVQSVFGGIYSTVMEKIDAARSFVKGGLDAISGFFSGLRLEFPKIKMPHFSIKGEFSLAPPSVPHLAVDWYRTGAIATGPSVVGIGEAGPEAVVPLSGRYMDPYADAVARRLSELGGPGPQGRPSVEQHFTFNNPVKSPDEVARAVRMAARYGLAAQG